MKFLDATGITTLVNKLKTKFQETLVSGTNIKTINNESILGSGDIIISGGGGQSSWYGTSNSAASATEKVVTCDGYVLTKGAIITVLFSTANSATDITLNVNGTGAKPIYVCDFAVVANNPLNWNTRTLLTFVYDGSNYCYIASSVKANSRPPMGGNTWYGTISGQATTGSKTGSVDNYFPVVGSIVVLRATTANTLEDALTIRIGSIYSSSYPIYKGNAATSSTNTLLWEIGEYLTFIFDGSCYRLIGRI